MRLLRLAAFASLPVLLPLACAAAAVPQVVVSIKPLHSLVAAVMAGVGEPALIVDGVGSPHTYAMKPSNAADLAAADIVFWAGDGLEAFLVKPLESLGTNAKIVELIDAPGLTRLPYRLGGAFETHRHEDEGEHRDDEAGHADHAPAEPHAEHEHDEAQGAYDMHIWLDPLNAKALAAEIERTLAAADPDHAAAYAANAEKLEARLDALVETTTADLAPVKDRPFVVFHDAYQYFENRFGVRAAGSITVSPETMPGVQRIAEIRAKLRGLGAACVFAEPQFEPKLVGVVIEGTDAHTGTLDPEGAALANGPELYFELIENLAASLKDCLSQPS